MKSRRVAILVPAAVASCLAATPLTQTAASANVPKKSVAPPNVERTRDATGPADEADRSSSDTARPDSRTSVSDRPNDGGDGERR